MPIFLELNIDVIHELEELRPYTVKQSWHKASDQDLNIYKNQLNLFSTNIPYMEHHFYELILAQWGLIFGIINALLH